MWVTLVCVCTVLALQLMLLHKYRRQTSYNTKNCFARSFFPLPPLCGDLRSHSLSCSSQHFSQHFNQRHPCEAKLCWLCGGCWHTCVISLCVFFSAWPKSINYSCYIANYKVTSKIHSFFVMLKTNNKTYRCINGKWAGTFITLFYSH